jgi:hypothetical protein
MSNPGPAREEKPGLGEWPPLRTANRVPKNCTVLIITDTSFLDCGKDAQFGDNQAVCDLKTGKHSTWTSENAEFTYQLSSTIVLSTGEASTESLPRRISSVPHAVVAN